MEKILWTDLTLRTKPKKLFYKENVYIYLEKEFVTILICYYVCVMNQHWPASDPSSHTTCDELMNEWVVVNTRENAGIWVHRRGGMIKSLYVFDHSLNAFRLKKTIGILCVDYWNRYWLWTVMEKILWTDLTLRTKPKKLFYKENVYIYLEKEFVTILICYYVCVMNQHWPASDPSSHTTCDELMNEWVVVNTRENAGIWVHDHRLLDMHTVYTRTFVQLLFNLDIHFMGFLFISLCLSSNRITYTYTIIVL